MGDPDTRRIADDTEAISTQSATVSSDNQKNSPPQLSPSGPIVVVGPCASGKTTLVNELRRLGYDAQVVAQEHSDIHHLWKRPNPSLVIVLEVDLETLRRRRGKSDWPESIYRTQLRRLEDATKVAAARVDTSSLSPMGVLAAATGTIREAGIQPRFTANGSSIT